jgi:predicted PurR-regulated permease PerM
MSASIESDLSRLRPFLIRTIVVVVAVGLLALVVYGSSVLLLIFAGMLFGVLLGRLTGYLSRFVRLPRLVSLILIVLLLIAAIAGFVPLIAAQAVAQVNQLVGQINATLDQIAEWLRQMNWSGGDVLDKLPWAGAVEGSLFTAVELVSGIVVVFFVGIYFAVDPAVYRTGLVKLFPKDRRERVRELAVQLEESLWKWIIGRTVIMATTALFVGLGLWAIGCPLSATLGLIAGLLAFVPTLGPIVAMAPALLVAIPLGWEMVLWVTVVYIVIQVAEANLLTPLVDQFQVSVPPVLLLGSQLLMGVLAGPLGIAVATPLCAVGLVLVKELYVKDVLEDHGDGDHEGDHGDADRRDADHGDGNSLSPPETRRTSPPTCRVRGD